MKPTCSICNSEELKSIISINSYPAYIVPVPKEIAKSIMKADLELFGCENCGHLQTLNPDKELQRLIYEQYYSHYVVDSSESFVPHYRKPFVDFLEKIKENKYFENKDNLLEIGCSSGQQVDLFKKFAKSYYGIDPSEKIHKAIQAYPNDHFIKGYFPESIPDISFDIIVSQFNLEHILNIQKFVSNVFTALNPNGLFVLQVPDIEDFLRNKLPNFLAHEHIQYFTKNTLHKLLESQGFQILAWGEQSPSLIVLAQKNKTIEKYDFKENTIFNINNWSQISLNFNNVPKITAKKIVFYGVGPQLYWLLSNISVTDFIVCDDNPNYEYQGLPGYGNDIMKPSKDIFLHCEVVVLSLNKFYHKKVVEKLKNYQIEMKICSIDENGNWITTNI